MQKFNFSYDKDNDDLFIFNPKTKSSGSIELGDLILDLDNNKKPVGLQIMNASKFLKEFAKNKKTASIKNILENLKECQIEIKKKNNMIIIKILLLNEVEDLTPIFSMPNIEESSPALVYA